MKRNRISISLTLAALLLAPAVLSAAGGSQTPDPLHDVPAKDIGGESRQLSPEEQAKVAYIKGLEHRDKAWKLEEETAVAGGKADKKAEKAQKAYRKAVEEYRTAVDLMPGFHQAWSSLGYALRKTGQYQESLEAYDKSLAIDPDYTEAIEYRGEAYLGLDRIEEAKGAYMQLFQLDRDRAAELMTAMKRWLQERSDDAGELSPEVIQEFATWVEERSEMVAQVGTLASVGRSW